MDFLFCEEISEDLKRSDLSWLNTSSPCGAMVRRMGLSPRSFFEELGPPWMAGFLHRVPDGFSGQPPSKPGHPSWISCQPVAGGGGGGANLPWGEGGHVSSG